MNRDHSFVVVGCGSLGCAALYWLSRMAAPYASVLGLERRELGRRRGDRGATVHHGPGRHHLAALAPAAREAWRQVEAVSGQRLVTETGGLVIEDAHGRGAVDRHLAVAERHGIAAEELDAAGLARRWPQFRPDGGERAVHRPGTGIVDTGRADATHVALAHGYGARVREHAPVRALRDAGRHVEVVTDDEVYRAEHVVLTAGARTPEVLDGVAALPLSVTRQHVSWYATPNLLDFSPERFPVFTWHGPGVFHGFPVHGEIATSVGRPAGAPDPASFLAPRLPGFGGPEIRTATRRAVTAPDGNGVLDTVGPSRRVTVAAGVGHAWGLASLAGRILAELAASGTTRHPIAGLAVDRPVVAGAPLARTAVPLGSRTWT